MLMTLSIDTSRIDDKITVLASELKSRFPNGIPERIDSELSRLSNDISLVISLPQSAQVEPARSSRLWTSAVILMFSLPHSGQVTLISIMTP